MDPLVQQIMTKFDEEHNKLKAGQANKFDEYFKSKGVKNAKLIKSTDGSTIYGAKKDNVISGPSIVKYINNTCYVGNMENNKRDGAGFRSYEDSSLFYVGNYKNDLKSGQGKLWSTKKLKWVFEGQWGNDKKNGLGTLLRDEGTYVGNWIDDRMDGKGKMSWLNGDEYEGDYKQDYRSGIGMMKYRNGDWYKGEFRNGVLNGKGLYTWKNGEKYDGGFTGGIMDGHGRIEYSGINCVGQGVFQSGSDRNLVFGLSGNVRG